MDSGKIGQNQGHHVIEHHLINKSRGDYFFEKFSFLWDSIWDMLLRTANVCYVISVTYVKITNVNTLKVNRLTPKLLADLFQPPILKPDPNRNRKFVSRSETPGLNPKLISKIFQK